MPPPSEAARRSLALTRVAEKHGQGNRKSKDDWDLYRQHRERLTGTLLAVAEQVARPAAASRICLLGAGNCNDVDLERLVGRFAAVHLVDIDPAALDRARSRQPAEVRARLVLHGGLDLTGLLSAIDRWGTRVPEPSALEAAAGAGLRALLEKLPAGDCDLAVSCCLMSQLGWSLETALDEHRRVEATRSGGRARGAAPPGLPDTTPGAGPELRQAMLTVHLRTLAQLVRPGGAAVLASDIVSSDHYPLEELAPDADLGALAERLIAEQQALYAGANPLLTSRTLRRDPLLKEAFLAPQARPPWLWTGQFGRTYLVYPQVLGRL